MNRGTHNNAAHPKSRDHEPRRTQRPSTRNAWFASLREAAQSAHDEGQPPRDLSESDILQWAEAFFARAGKWPSCLSGEIPEAPGETWLSVEAALSLGLRGLPGRSTLARFLAEKRGRRHYRDPRRLTIRQILSWADRWHRENGRWPHKSSGTIPDTDSVTWSIVDYALRAGLWGLPDGSSLASLLDTARGVINNRDRPRLTEKRILLWADEHRKRTGSWPSRSSGPVTGARGETWGGIENALRKGSRGLRGGSSLAALLADKRGLRNVQRLPRLSQRKILIWADVHHDRTVQWPSRNSGPIAEAPGETWGAVNGALYNGGRGLSGGTTLAQLLEQSRRKRNRRGHPLSVAQILAWADAFHGRTKRWPVVLSGPVPGAPGETWSAIHEALYRGQRGLPGASSLARLLAQERGVKNHLALPPLRIPEVVRWAKAHQARTGSLPRKKSGRIPEAPGETWSGVYHALREGRRGLSGGMSLVGLFSEHGLSPTR